MKPRALIVGCGYTGRRVASLLLDRSWEVIATTRSPDGLADLKARGARVARFNVEEGTDLGLPADGLRILVSLPTLRPGDSLDEPTPRVVAAFRGTPESVCYLSTTGVYGAAGTVDESTPATPDTERGRLRLAAERTVRSLPCRSLVLRPAAIYGPGRGAHEAMRAGTFRLPEHTDRFVSRIHVDDLARIVAAAMERGLEGVYPVADEEPATAHEVARFCAGLLDLEMAPEVPDDDLPSTRRSNRRVDGTAVTARLGLRLRYPNYRVGIPASLAG